MIKQINLAIGIGFLLFLSGCVDKHKNRINQQNENLVGKFNDVIVDGRVVGTELSGEVFKLKDIKAKYMVTSNFLGCRTVTKEGRVTTVSEPGKETLVVKEEGDKVTECLTPASVSLSEVRPEIQFHRGVRPTQSDYVIQTRGVIRASGATRAKNGITVEGDNLNIKHLSYVDFTTNSPFLAPHVDKVDLKGDPATTYKVLHKLTPEHLVIMRVSDMSGLSHRELSIADNLGNGEFAVPVGFYSISYMKEDFVRNGDNERTNLKNYFPVSNVDDATHVRFNVLDDFSELDYSTFFKQDVYPASYFTKGQWYFSESVVDTRPGLEGLIGTSTGAFDFDFRPASKIKFFRTNDMLNGYNIGVDERVDIDSDLKLSPVVEIPAEGISYRLAANGVSEVIENDVVKKEAPYIRMNFQNATTLLKRVTDVIRLGPTVLAAGRSEVIDIKFAENSFSFTLQLGATGRRVKYSFLRADNRPEYKERRHYAGDRNTFGYFVQRKSKIISSDVTHREEDIEKDFFIQRHNPDQTVKFYFSNLTPKYEETREVGDKDIFGMDIDYREIGRKAVAYWDAAFKRAGAKGVDLIERVDGKSFDAPFGDIAYSTINLIESETGSNLLGVGPSLTDPFTGEVINTNANVYIAPFREILAGQIRNYIKSQTGYTDNVAKNLPASGIVNSSILGDVAGYGANIRAFVDNLFHTNKKRMWNIVANLYHQDYQGIRYDEDAVNNPTHNGYENINLYTLNHFDPTNSQIQSLVELGKNIPEVRSLEAIGEVSFNIRDRSSLALLASRIEQYRPSFYRAFFTTEDRKLSEFNSLTRDIENRCDAINTLIKNINNKSITELTTAIEAPALQACMSKLIPDKFMATLVHEMGHNLGLRHNFKASSDKENFFTKEEVKDLYGLDMQDLDLPRSSSTMDYVRTEQDRLFFPGHYDIAAIRYGYTNSVEVNSGAERPNSVSGKYLDLSKNLELDPEGSIASLVSQEGEELRAFGFCTDSKASLQLDPMCRRHDFGTTPEMSVDDTINSFWESFALWNFRYDRSSAGVTRPLFRDRNFDNAKRMYDEWRFHLADYLGQKDSGNSGYLERFSPEEYSKLIAEVQNDPNFKGKDYLSVRRKVFDFFMDVTFFPNKYCLTNSETVGLKAIEFEKLRDELKNQVPDGTKVSECSDQYIQDLITEKDLTYLSEVGLPVNNMWDYVNPKDTFDPNFADSSRGLRRPIDTVGTFIDRFFASGALTARQSGTGYRSFIEGLFPSILDEPDFLLEYEERVLSRIINGVDLTDVISRVEGIDFPPGQRIRASNFEAESGFLKALWLSLENGIRNPHANVSDRVARYGRFFTDDLGQIQNAQASGGFALPLADGRSLIVPNTAEVTLGLAEKYVEILQQISTANTVVPEDKDVIENLRGLVTSLAQILVPLEGASSITAEQYVFFNTQVFRILGQLDPAEQQVFMSIFFEETIMYQAVLQQANEAINFATEQRIEPLSADIALMTNTLADWNLRGLEAVAAEIQAAVAEQLPEGVQVLVPSAEGLIAKFNEFGEVNTTQILGPMRANVAQASAIFDLNEEDIFAQFDLIRSILTFDLQGAGQEFVTQISELLSDNGSDYATHYSKLKSSSREDVRFFAEKYLDPSRVLVEQGIINKGYVKIKPIN